MASSQKALQLVRPFATSAPHLSRRTITSGARKYAQQPPSSSAQTQKSSVPFAASQARSTKEPLSSPKTSTTSSSSSPSWRPPSTNPLMNPPTISAEERPPYQYPDGDPTPLPSAPSSFESHQAIPSSSMRASLDQGPLVDQTIDWGSSYHGLSAEPFSEKAQAILQAPIPMNDVEVKPDGIIYLPEIKYRRILNSAFGPGGWGLAPRGELHVGERVVTREFALVVGGRFVALARGECAYYGEDNVPNAIEGCKSNALTRCCKDLGIASELWDPRFIRKYTKEYTKQVEVYYGLGLNAKKKKITIRKDDEVMPPFRLVSGGSSTTYAAARTGTTTAAKAAATTTTAAKTATAARPVTSTATKTTKTATSASAAAARKA